MDQEQNITPAQALNILAQLKPLVALKEHEFNLVNQALKTLALLVSESDKATKKENRKNKENKDETPVD